MYPGERFNGYTHLGGALLATAGAAVLIVLASLKGDPWRISAFAVYGASLVFLYTASTLYHSTRGRAKAVFRKIDHSAIYLLIAGTYTPFALVTLNGPWGWTLFGLVWGLAVVGIAQELLFARGARVPSLVIYLVMGWSAIAAVVPLVESLGWTGLAWVAAGGVIYTVGIVFYVYDKKVRHFHGIWHLFVMGGSAVHYAAIVRFIA
ncbi:MAG: hemolysin III family protein [Betaproteobacteria bacterium]|nr:hemolysin III family protein [Betaproteobacteria bacterium]